MQRSSFPAAEKTEYKTDKLDHLDDCEERDANKEPKMAANFGDELQSVFGLFDFVDGGEASRRNEADAHRRGRSCNNNKIKSCSIGDFGSYCMKGAKGNKLTYH